MVNIRLDGVPRSGFIMTRQSFLDGGIGLIQRIENRASGIPSLLEQARSDLASAETERDDAEQRIGQPFRHAQALADAEKDLARIETQLAAMQEPCRTCGSRPASRPRRAAPTRASRSPPSAKRPGARPNSSAPASSRSSSTREPPPSPSDRPELMRMIQYVKANKVSYCIVTRSTGSPGTAPTT
jgi:hypothetical protein